MTSDVETKEREYARKLAEFDLERVWLREEMKNAHRLALLTFDRETTKLRTALKEGYRKSLKAQ